MNAFANVWHVLAAILTLALAVYAAAHAILYKRDVRAALGWAGFILFVPLLGSIAYVVFGINRIQRRAKRLRSDESKNGSAEQSSNPESRSLIKDRHPHFSAFAKLADKVTNRPLTSGNAITPITSERMTFDAMIDAIDSAQRTLGLATYIFDRGDVGDRFLGALQNAVVRGVDVRVLVDAVGARYSFPSILHQLRRRGITCARFGRTIVPWRWPYFNLRNHRKLLIADGQLGLTGGINIRDGYLAADQARGATRDLHFRLQGPVVGHLSTTFLEDWTFSSGETLDPATWSPSLDARGIALARGISDGPDEDFEKLKWILLGALATARQRVRIATPYFLPDNALIAELNLAAMHGVDVEILLPAKNNLRLVHWASRHQFWQLLVHGCSIYLAPPPFNHGKLMTVDDRWALFGSANWDPRSLRLNFEFNVECYDPQVVEDLNRWFDVRARTAHKTSLREMDERNLAVRLRDATARLMMPYL